VRSASSTGDFGANYRRGDPDTESEDGLATQQEVKEREREMNGRKEVSA
jgi:hypothetical protein